MLIYIIASLIVLMYAVMFYVRWRLDRNIRSLKMLQERNKQILLLRLYVLHVFGVEAWYTLPDRETMLYSDKPLVVKEWIEVDKLVNLN